jgi:hypothetical protein
MNPQRGEVAIEINGETRKLCLTLGALAEIEMALGCASLKDLSLRLKQVSAGDLIKLLAALLRGGGEVEAARSIMSAEVSPGLVMSAILECFGRSVP